MHRRVLVTHRLQVVAWHATTVLLAVTALVMLDWFVRWPWAMRVLLLATFLVIWIRVVRSLVLHHWMQAPTLRAVALRLERLEPELSGHLTSAIEFQASGAGPGQRMADEVIQSTTSAWKRLQPDRHLRRTNTIRAVAVALLAMGSASWLAHRQPEMVGVGLRRTLTPWTQDRWPSRVEIRAGDLPDMLARGASVDLQARLVRGERDGMRVLAICTIEDASGRRTERRIDLTRQADGSHARTIPAEGDRLVIQLAAGDAVTDAHEIRVVAAPQVVEGTLVVAPPRHAEGLVKPLQASWRGHDAGDYSGVLEGSMVTLDLTLAAPAPQVAVKEGDTPVVNMKGAAPLPEPTITVIDPTHWRLAWTAAASTEIQVRPSGAEGVRAPDPLRITINTIPDRAPSVSVTDPTADEIVTPLAQMPFTIEARDDLQLVESGWRLDRQQRSGEPSPVPLKQAARAVGGTESRIEAMLDMPSLQVRTGDTLLLRGTALDGMEAAGTPRGIVVSEPRRIRVVDAPTLERQVRQQAEGLRQVVTRLEQAQDELSRDMDARSQTALGERIRQARTAASQLADRMARNGLEEQALAEALREARDAGVEAGEASNAASEALRQAAEGDAAARSRAQKAQADAKEELQRMGEALERDDRTAGAQRRAERIAGQIEQLRKDLQQASRGSEGRMLEEIQPERRQAIQE